MRTELLGGQPSVHRGAIADCPNPSPCTCTCTCTCTCAGSTRPRRRVKARQGLDGLHSTGQKDLQVIHLALQWGRLELGGIITLHVDGGTVRTTTTATLAIAVAIASAYNRSIAAAAGSGSATALLVSTAIVILPTTTPAIGSPTCGGLPHDDAVSGVAVQRKYRQSIQTPGLKLSEQRKTDTRQKHDYCQIHTTYDVAGGGRTSAS